MFQHGDAQGGDAYDSTSQGKDTRNRAGKPLKPSEVAVLIAAAGTVLSELAVRLNALTPWVLRVLIRPPLLVS